MRRSKDAEENAKFRSFADNLRRLRKTQGLSQGELGELAQLHFGHISRYERGLVQPSKDALMRLASALKISVQQLIENGPPQPELGKVDPEMTRRLQEIETLPAADKESVKKLLDAFLLRQKVQDLKTG